MVSIFHVILAKYEGIAFIVGSRGSSQLGRSLLGIPLGYKTNKLLVSLSYPVGIKEHLFDVKKNTLYFVYLLFKSGDYSIYKKIY